MARATFAGEGLCIDFALQRHEGVHQRFRPRWAARNVNIHRNITIDALEHVVTLLERPTRNRACPHGDHVLWFGHLVVEAHNLRGHFFGDGAGNDHEVRLARRGPENFGTEAREIVTRHRRSDHFDGATGETELQWPDRVFAAPVVNVLDLNGENPLLAQLTAQPLVWSGSVHFQVSTPFIQAHASPTANRSMNTSIAINAPTGRFSNATANGTRNKTSTSKMR